MGWLVVTGEELYAKYGEPILGPWSGQTSEVQQAWRDLAGQVNEQPVTQ